MYIGAHCKNISTFLCLKTFIIKRLGKKCLPPMNLQLIGCVLSPLSGRIEAAQGPKSLSLLFRDVSQMPKTVPGA